MSCEAFEEFASLWLDQFDQETLPADTVQILCVLTTSSRHVPSKTAKRHLAAKWKKQINATLHSRSHLHDELSHLHHFEPDEILEVTQRLGKLSAKEAVSLAAGQK